MLLSRLSAIAGALMACAVTGVSAQQANSEDTRTQYPAFLADSYVSVNVGAMGYRFTERQLEPGFGAQSIETPPLAVRVDFFGHRFTRHLAVQATYMRPVEFVAYRNINGTAVTRTVSNAYGGLTLVWDVPLSARVSAYGEGGLGITSRSGFEIDGAPALRPAHYAGGLVGAGLAYHATPKVDLVLSTTFSPGRKSFDQPSTRLIATGIRYAMRRLPADTVEVNRRAGFAFPANLVRVGYTTNALNYGVNNFFSRTVPIFWGGNVETRRGVSLAYERNVFHTRKRFAFDLGTSLGSWQSNGNGESFVTLSAYPLFRFFLARTVPADVYVNYSLAGPTFISRVIIDGSDTGKRFTFQDFMGVGTYLGKTRRLNVELGIKHYSNGNMFTTNASVKVPLTLMIGLTF